jgi:FtsP/CotA-like multicopper oxidase with cupredoxin domain
MQTLVVFPTIRQEDSMAARDMRVLSLRASASISTPSRMHVPRWLAAAFAAGAAMLVQMPSAGAQLLPDCLPPGQPLLRIPELISQDGKLRGTILLADEQQRVNFSTGCALQYMRYFRGEKAVTPQAMPQPGVPPAPPPPPGARSAYIDPVPGPTLRARLGDLIELTFLNQIDPNHYGDSIDRGENAGACDATSGSPGYPQSANDTFPDCFHGSSTGNIHFHGTHTNPTSTGDNVFIQVRPSPRQNGKPTVNADSVKTSFDKFFADCENQLKNNVLSEWPYKWGDLPPAWTQEQQTLLNAYDHGTSPYSPPPKPAAQQLWPPDQTAINDGTWPQFYVGAYPYCFQLPKYTATVWPPPVPPGHAGMPMPPPPALQMGQAPGIHWYHAHKHGSTTLNVENGMTGAFIIEGSYDDELNKYYGTSEVPDWTRRQPVLVLNQLGVSTNLLGGSGFGGGGPPFSVNGRAQPKLTMRPNEVQLWRIVNTSARSGAFFVGFQTAAGQKANFAWKQLAQDGVQFVDQNYQSGENDNPAFTMMSGNRVDLLVQAPPASPTGQAQTYNVVVQPTVARHNRKAPVTLMTVEVSGSPATGHQATFIPRAPSFPRFLADITDAEVKYTPKRTLTFNSDAPGAPHQHTINNEQFSDKVGVSVVLEAAEEWKIENTTNSATGPGVIDHPFHIHVNPFQVVEVFDPNEMLVIPGGPVFKYIFQGQPGPDQCLLNINDENSWKPCGGSGPASHRIWWDVFPIPSGRSVTVGTKTAIIPGYFKMRSRFVDYHGQYVLHCHILAHEDRGMMMIVEVRPNISPLQHH